MPLTSECASVTPVTLSNENIEGYLASSVTQKTGCGDVSRPWLLTAGVGQNINVTLLDFASHDRSINSEDFECVVYATIKDISNGMTHTVCGGGNRRIVPAFISSSNVIEIRLTGKSIRQENNEGHYLLKYSGQRILWIK